MATFFQTTFSDQLVNGKHPVACPRCQETRGHTVEGYLGSPGKIRCRSGHTFNFPRGWDATSALIQAATDPRRVRTR